MFHSTRVVLELGLDPAKMARKRTVRLWANADNARAVLAVLRENGLTEAQVKQTVHRHCPILAMSPAAIAMRARLLLDFGVHDIAGLIASKPGALSYRLEDHLARNFAYLQSELSINHASMMHLLSCHPHTFGSQQSTLEEKVGFWRDRLDADLALVGKLLVKYPSLLSPSPAYLHKKWAELEAVGFDPATIHAMVRAVPAVLCIGHVGRATGNVDFLTRELGVSRDDILACTAVTPVLLIKNLDSPLYHLKLRFLRDFIQVPDLQGQLLIRPTYLGYSLVGRIGPRSAFMKHRGLPLHTLQYVAYSEAAWLAWLAKVGKSTPGCGGTYGNCRDFARWT
ncbi:hypothetical protein WJX72_009010 [[Myrmecia] bisecta]|uniref:Uncharacterized protein n=1 Tax=[Myrmecia] bisecta TaxID=41462 RepID=A0AAW1P713_9CHLO